MTFWEDQLLVGELLVQCLIVIKCKALKKTILWRVRHTPEQEFELIWAKCLCRGQAYDGATTMQGKRSGLATHIWSKVPAALPVRCLAHSLNLCLQDTGRHVQYLRDAIAIVRDVVKLSNYSSKRRCLFFEKLLQFRYLHSLASTTRRSYKSGQDRYLAFCMTYCFPTTSIWEPLILIYIMHGRPRP